MAERVVVFGLRNWLGSPRLPRALQQAGFEVALLCGAGTLLSLTRFHDRRIELRADLPLRELFGPLWQAVVDWGASSVIAVDDLAISLLYEFTERVEEGELDERAGIERFKAALRRSLPPARQRRALTHKSGARALAQAAGIPGPEQRRGPAPEQALELARASGWPVVLKFEEGAGGTGVAVCHDSQTLHQQHARLAARFGRDGDNPMLCEAFVEGPQLSHAFVAEGGRVLCGLTRLKLEAFPDAFGPSSVAEIVDRPEIAQYAGRFAQASAYSGFASLQFLDDPRRGPQFLEFNSRPVPIMHLGEDQVGIDWCRAWHAAMQNRPPPPFRGPQTGRRIALFPQEWLRDHDSRHLRGDTLHDVPWDDPALLQAYLRVPRPPEVSRPAT
jgi:hypothetical protein